MKEKHSILLEIKALSNFIQRQLDSKSENNLTGMQGYIIGYLSKSKEKKVFQRDIEEKFRIRRSTATGILKLMEKNGLIERYPAKYDARLKEIILTQKAQILNEKFVQTAQRLDERIEEGLSEQEISVFFEILDKIRKNIE